MTADVLREAARLMRHHARKVEASDSVTPWGAIPTVDPDNHGWVVINGVTDADYDNTVAATEHDWVGTTAHHIASWHPTVALAVADWLDAQAADLDSYDEGNGWVTHEWHVSNDAALAVARAYLADPA